MRFWLIFVLFLPVTAVQGAWLRRNAPRMPALLSNADIGEVGCVNLAPGLRLTVVGESPAVGVGCDVADQSITIRLATALAEADRRRVTWQVIGANGARAQDIANMLVTQSSATINAEHIALVLLGVNDVTALRSRRHWREQLISIRRRLRARGVGHIYLAPVPPIWQFTLLPRPLRWVMGLRARSLEAERLTLPRTYPDMTALTTEFPDRPDLLARDGFHPGPGACSLWASQLAEQIIACRNSSEG